jgi:hypothetical protein
LIKNKNATNTNIWGFFLISYNPKYHLNRIWEKCLSTFDYSVAMKDSIVIKTISTEFCTSYWKFSIEAFPKN